MPTPIVDEQVKRLNIARQKVEEISREKSRLSGELDSLTKRLEELEVKTKEEYDCTIDQLPQLKADFDVHSEESLNKAETILGIKSEESDQDSLT